MSGKYFGRWPLMNAWVSKMIFAALAHRRKALLRRANRENLPAPQPDAGLAKEQLAAWMAKGYDKLNLGGGSKNLRGFINVDFIDRPGVERKVVADIRDLSFVPTGSVSHIHSNHVVEHFSLQDFEQQLRQSFRILKDDGLLSLRCPNALGVCYGFFFGAVPEERHEDFLRLGYPADEEFHNPADNWYHKDLWGLFHWLWAYPGNSENSHLSQFTPSLMKKTLAAGGFEILKMTNPETSNIIVVAKKKISFTKNAPY